jgi:hypothetical protein
MFQLGKKDPRRTYGFVLPVESILSNELRERQLQVFLARAGVGAHIEIHHKLGTSWRPID